MLLIMMFLFLGALGCMLAIIAYRLFRYPFKGLRCVLDTDSLGRLEGSLPDLKRVIVIATKIEDPQHELREAVKSNFKRGIKYLFLISQSTAQGELNGYYQIFKALAQIEGKKADSQDLVDIHELPYDWSDYPYIFYETRAQTAAESTFTAFRGNQQLEGIADLYSPVEVRYAHTIASAVLSGAPKPIAVRADQFEDAAKILPFSQEPSQGREAKAN